MHTLVYIMKRTNKTVKLNTKKIQKFIPLFAVSLLFLHRRVQNEGRG